MVEKKLNIVILYCKFFPHYFFWSLPFYRQTSLKACDAHRIKNNVEVSTLNSGGMLDIIYTMAKEIINCVLVA